MNDDHRLATSKHLRLHPALVDLIEKEADRAGMHLNEWLAEVIAKKMRRPELAIIPRRRMGRPPKKALELAS